MQETHWQDYLADKTPETHTVTGSLKLLKDLYSPQLHNQRDILVHLPQSYSTSQQRYPVIYMHDGQNLFDVHTSFAGEWGVDETLAVLAREGLEAIVVGIPSIGSERLNEYSPFKDVRHGGGRGQAYLNFIVETLKPLVDAEYRTLADRDHTGIMGSSMGGLISLYGYFYRAETFGFAGVMSPAFWFARRAIFPYIHNRSYLPGKIYLDAGTAESRRWYSLLPRRYFTSVTGDTQEMFQRLVKMGFQPGREVVCVEEEGGQHNEAAWARRLPAALRFLLS